MDVTTYAYKHYESVFTRFFQDYILPEKFGSDMRRPEKPHSDYPSEDWLRHGLIGLYRKLNLTVGKTI